MKKFKNTIFASRETAPLTIKTKSAVSVCDCSSLTNVRASARLVGGGADSELVSFENCSNIQVAGPASRWGFTLAEVLITLGIIGVVCALTLPNLVASYQKHVTVEQLRVAYNLFSNVIEQAKLDYGDPIILPDDISGYTSQMSEMYFEPYIKDVEAYPGSKIIYAKTPDKKNIFTEFGIGENRKTMCTPKGVCYKLYRHATGYIRFIIDLNGPKGPNIAGRDVFEFDMTPLDIKKCGGGYHCIVAPHPYEEGSWSAFGVTIDGCCSKTPSECNGKTCASKIIRDGWQIKDDYPW